jgi:hypothetical protein
MFVSETDQSRSMMFKYGDRTGGDDDESYLRALQTIIEQFQLSE